MNVRFRSAREALVNQPHLVLQLVSMATKIMETADRSRILHGLAAWQVSKFPSLGDFRGYLWTFEPGDGPYQQKDSCISQLQNNFLKYVSWERRGKQGEIRQSTSLTDHENI